MTTENDKDQDLNKETPADEPKLSEQAQDELEFGDEFDKLSEKDADPDKGGETDGADPEKGGADADAEAKAAKAAKAAQEPAKAEPDPLADLPEAAKKAVDELRTKAALAEHQASSSNGRVSALTKKIDELSRAIPKAPTQAQVRVALKSPESWKAFEEQFPDVAKPVGEYLKTLDGSIDERINARVDARVKPHDEARQQDEIARATKFEDEQVELLTKAHPDYKKTVNTPEFKQWIATQPPIIQAGIGSVQAADAIAVINLYKSATSPVADLNQRRQQRLNQAAAIPGSTRAASNGRQAEVPDDFNAAWDHYDRQQARR